MGNGGVIPAAASAATIGAGTPAAAKETARGAVGEAAWAAAMGLVRRRLARAVDGPSTGRADKKNLRTRGGRISKATTSVETSSLVSSVRPARHDGCACLQIAG